jgi:hypothetical protein
MQQRFSSEGPPIFELALGLLRSVGQRRPIANGAILRSSTGRTLVTVYHRSLDAGNRLELAFNTAELAKGARIPESEVLAWIARASETSGRPARPKFSQQWPRVGMADETQLHDVATSLVALLAQAPVPPLQALPEGRTGVPSGEGRVEDQKRALAAISAISVERYADVLAELDATITPAQREMLVGHARAPGCTLSMQKLAELGGYSEYVAANLQYGLLGGRVAAALGVSGLENEVQALCELAPDRDEAGHEQWKLRQRVVDAMRELELIPPDEPVDGAGLAVALSMGEDVRDKPPTTREALIQARIGQGAYRRKMLRWWGGCAVTGCTVFEAIVASHVLPWEDSSDEQRLDHWNGLPLVGTLDRLFDRGLISFSDTGAMLLSARLRADDLEKLGLRAGSQLRRTNPPLLAYLREHRRRNGFDAD